MSGEENDTGGKTGERKSDLVLPPSGLAKDILGAHPVPGGELPAGGSGEPDRGREPNRPGDEIQMKYVTFRLEQEEYGLPISHVREINRVGEITRVPNSSQYLMGVINLRGKIIPVIELKRRLRLGPTAVNRESRIIIAENGPKLLGLLVDQVSEVRAILSGQIEAPPDEVKVNGNLITGVAKLDERRLVILLDPELIWNTPPEGVILENRENGRPAPEGEK